MALGDGASGTRNAPPPAVGASLIAAAAVVLIIGMIWLGRGDEGEDRLAMPTADGLTLPTDSDGRQVDVPPSQPATAVVFGPDGQILRPDPVRARVVDGSGVETIIVLPPNTTVDTVTGEIVTKPTGSSTSSGGSTTTRDTTTTTRDTSTTTTTTTEPPTTTEPTTTTTEPTTTTSDTLLPPIDPPIDGGTITGE